MFPSKTQNIPGHPSTPFVSYGYTERRFQTIRYGNAPVQAELTDTQVQDVALWFKSDSTKLDEAQETEGLETITLMRIVGEGKAATLRNRLRRQTRDACKFQIRDSTFSGQRAEVTEKYNKSAYAEPERSIIGESKATERPVLQSCVFSI